MENRCQNNKWNKIDRKSNYAMVKFIQSNHDYRVATITRADKRFLWGETQPRRGGDQNFSCAKKKCWRRSRQKRLPIEVKETKLELVFLAFFYLFSSNSEELWRKRELEKFLRFRVSNRLWFSVGYFQVSFKTDSWKDHQQKKWRLGWIIIKSLF